MSLQTAALIKPLGAIRALPRLLLGVDPDAPLQRALFGKLAVTNRALPRTVRVIRLLLCRRLHREMGVYV